MLAYLPSLSDVIEVVLAVLLFAALIVVGAAFGGHERRRAFDPLVGWAIGCLPFVVLGTLTTLSFFWIDAIDAVICAIAAALCLRRGIPVGLANWIPYVILSSPLLIIVAPTDLYGWDQLSHWLPNADYIASFQHFPHEGLPPSPSAHAGYPYGFALAIYGVNMAAQGMASPTHVVGIAATLNVLLLVVAARMLVDTLREIARPPASGAKALGAILFAENIWLAAGLSLLLVTALSPSFLPSNSLSASADNATSVALFAIALAIAPSDAANTRAHMAQRMQLACLLVLVVLLKEDDAVPAVALLAGRVVWDASTGRDFWRALRDFALACLPMLIVAVLWHTYVYLQIPQGEMTLRAPSAWRFDLLLRVLWGMIMALVSKLGFLFCAVLTLFAAARSLWRKGNMRSFQDAFAVIAATGFVGYTLFLAFAYISIFTEAEAERQAAFWRYETHLGLVLEAAVILLAGRIVVRQRSAYGRLALPVAATMVLAPVILAPAIRPDLDPQYRALRTIGVAVAPYIAAARDIYIVDQFGNGAPCPMIVYEAHSTVRLAGCVTKISPCPACLIQKAAAEERFMWTNGWSPQLANATHLQLAENGAYLLQRVGEMWELVATWPRTPTKIRGVRAIWQTS